MVIVDAKYKPLSAELLRVGLPAHLASPESAAILLELELDEVWHTSLDHSAQNPTRAISVFVQAMDIQEPDQFLPNIRRLLLDLKSAQGALNVEPIAMALCNMGYKASLVDELQANLERSTVKSPSRSIVDKENLVVKKAPPKIFISHAVHDEKLAGAFRSLLQLGVGFSADEIFLSTTPGSIPSGTDFVHYIKEKLSDATAVVSLVTEAYYDRAFCMCELGGAWVRGASTHLLLAPDMDFREIPTTHRNDQAALINNQLHLTNLRKELKHLSSSVTEEGEWIALSAAFVQNFDNLYKPYKGDIKRDVYRKMLAQKKAAEARSKELQSELDAANALILQLQSLKNKEQVKGVVAANSSFEKRFTELTREVKTAIGEVGRAANHLFFFRQIGDTYYFREGHDEFSDFEDMRHNRVVSRSDDDNEWSLNENDEDVEAAVSAIESLADFLGDPPKGFDLWYSANYRGKPDLNNKSFWTQHLFA